MRQVSKFLWLALLVLRAAGAAEADGPYVLRNAAGKLAAWSLDATSGSAPAKPTAVAPGSKLTVPAVGHLPAFDVTLRAPAAIAADVVTAGAGESLFVVADTHGEFEIFADMLMKQDVVDDRLHWSFGRGRLVLLGDAFDRGAHQLEILWLIYELEAQARQAGGAVYFVLGNHEVMALRGDARYLHPKYRETAQRLGVDSYARLFDAGSVLGQWLRSRPAVLRLNDLLCLHGGISPALVERKFGIEDINESVRAVLEGREPAGDPARADFLFGEEGPLWYRGYFPAEAGGKVASDGELAGILRHFGAHRILVGHTRVPTITPLYDGKVIAVQVYPRLDSFGNEIFEALLIRGGLFWRALPDGRREALSVAH